MKKKYLIASIIFFVVCVVLSILYVKLYNDKYPFIQTAYFILLVLNGGIYLGFIYYNNKCPSCGKFIRYIVRSKHCPYCGKELEKEEY